MTKIEAPGVFAYKPEEGINQVAAPPLSYRLTIVAILVAIFFIKNLSWEYLVDLEIRLVFDPDDLDLSAWNIEDDFYKNGWPLSFMLASEDASAALKIRPWRAILFACFNVTVGAWLVCAAYGYLCECYLMLGWRLNATILVSVVVILFSLFVAIQDRFEDYNGVGAVSGAIIRLSDSVMPALLFCGFLLLFEKLSQAWNWLVAKKS